VAGGFVKSGFACFARQKTYKCPDFAMQNLADDANLMAGDINYDWGIVGDVVSDYYCGYLIVLAWV
jgi:hypothetical protein